MARSALILNNPKLTLADTAARARHGAVVRMSDHDRRAQPAGDLPDDPGDRLRRRHPVPRAHRLADGRRLAARTGATPPGCRSSRSTTTPCRRGTGSSPTRRSTRTCKPKARCT